MPTYKKLKSGNWQARVECKPHKTLYKTFRNKALAIKWGENTLDKLKLGEVVEETIPTLAEAIDKYMRDISPLMSDSGESLRRSHAKMYKEAFGDKLLTQVTSSVILEKYALPRLQEVTSDTLRRSLSLLSQVYQYSEYQNPIPQVRSMLSKRKKTRPASYRKRRITASEETQLLKSCSSIHPELLLAVQIILATGLRRSEFCDIDQDALNGLTLQVQAGKTGKTRYIPVSEATVQLIKKALELRKFGISLHPSTISHYFLKACRKAKIEDLHLHDIRSEFAHRCIENHGLTIIEVATLLGNSPIVCAKHYANNMEVDNIAKKLLG